MPFEIWTSHRLQKQSAKVPKYLHDIGVDKELRRNFYGNGMQRLW